MGTCLPVSGLKVSSQLAPRVGRVKASLTDIYTYSPPMTSSPVKPSSLAVWIWKKQTGGLAFHVVLHSRKTVLVLLHTPALFTPYMKLMALQGKPLEMIANPP